MQSFLDAIKTHNETQGEAGEHEFLDRNNKVKLPFKFETKNHQLVEFDWMTLEALPAVYDIIQDYGAQAGGLNPEDFSPIGKLELILSPLIAKKQAMQVRNVRSRKVIGVYYIQPASICRSTSPVMNAGYGLIHKEYHDTGIMGIGSILYGLVARKRMFGGTNGRVAVKYPSSFSAILSRGSKLTAFVPKSNFTPKFGWTDDYIIHNTFRTKDDRLFKISEEEVKARATSNLKPVALEERTYTYLNKTLVFPGDRNVNICSSTRPDQLNVAYNVLYRAAEEGESFGIDEFPSFDTFQNIFLNCKQLITIHINNELAGVAVFGSSHLCRSVNSPNAVIYLYMLHEFRGKGYGTEIFQMLEKYTEENGYDAVLIDALTTKDFNFKFLHKLGYTITGSVPYSAYVKGQGWTDALVFYKRLQSTVVLSLL